VNSTVSQLLHTNDPAYQQPARCVTPSHQTPHPATMQALHASSSLVVTQSRLCVASRPASRVAGARSSSGSSGSSGLAAAAAQRGRRVLARAADTEASTSASSNPTYQGVYGPWRVEKEDEVEVLW
jgi:hypothetical protein